MQTKSTRIAYLKRMLKRLDAEDERLQGLVSAGELTHEAAALGAKQLNRDRNELLVELKNLEGDGVVQPQ